MAPDQEKDPLDVDAAIERLNRALALQYRSTLGYTVAAGSVIGFEHQGVADLLWRFAQAELDDTRRVVEKIVTLGGEPVVAPAEVVLHTAPEDMVAWLVEVERETLEAFQDVIPTTGHTADSEALEHRLEHLIMRKQEQVDALERARRRS
ncbi:ferritin-like domain-containing protein [Baekduia sp. Peel2402]|uniref:ferritin-like domain-containing protein n=1 Tax=Baekduia sp. Peel2402 TaxID=3458296 RepID=UPI00403E4FAC